MALTILKINASRLFIEPPIQVHSFPVIYCQITFHSDLQSDKLLLIKP